MIRHIVVAAVIKNKDKDRIYIQQREGEKEFEGKWELPGGKVENGESFESALLRELHEELRPIEDDETSFYIEKFIGATVKVGTKGEWTGLEYLLMFYEVRLDSTIIPSATNYMWLGNNQVEAFRDKLIPDNFDVIMESFLNEHLNNVLHVAAFDQNIEIL